MEALDDDARCRVAVFHPGSFTTEVGVVGDDAPRGVFRTLATPSPAGRWDVDTGFGDAHFDLPADAVVPYDHGVVTNWDAMEGLLRHSLESELAFADHDSLIITEAPWATPRCAPGHRESWLELAFESCDRRAVLCASQPLLALMASGRMVGATLSVGHQVTTACTFGAGGHPLRFCRSNVGGVDVTHALGRSMAGRGYDFRTPQEREVLRDIKEKMAFVPVTAADEVPASAFYELPDLADGDGLTCLGEQRVRCYDALFAPPPASGALSVARTLASVLLPDAEQLVDSQRVSVALCGATTLANGFASRVQGELNRRLASSHHSLAPIRVVAPPERTYLEWIGGSILGSLSTSADRFVTKATYDEEGAAAVARRFDQFSR